MPYSHSAVQVNGLVTPTPVFNVGNSINVLNEISPVSGNALGISQDASRSTASGHAINLHPMNTLYPTNQSSYDSLLQYAIKPPPGSAMPVPPMGATATGGYIPPSTASVPAPIDLNLSRLHNTTIDRAFALPHAVPPTVSGPVSHNEISGINGALHGRRMESRANVAAGTGAVDMATLFGGWDNGAAGGRTSAESVVGTPPFVRLNDTNMRLGTPLNQVDASSLVNGTNRLPTAIAADVAHDNIDAEEILEVQVTGDSGSQRMSGAHSVNAVGTVSGKRKATQQGMGEIMGVEEAMTRKQRPRGTNSGLVKRVLGIDELKAYFPSAEQRQQVSRSASPRLFRVCVCSPCIWATVSSLRHPHGRCDRRREYAESR